MYISELKNVLPKIMSVGEVPILVGHAGVGKTDVIKQIGKETNREVKILVLSQMEPGDLLGMPSRDGDRTVWLKPDWFPRSDNEILFLDEINRASDITRAAVMQLLLDRRLNDHVLPDGVWLVAAMNPDTEKYELNQIIDQAFIDRFVWIKVTNNLYQFKEYAGKSKQKNEAYIQALSKLYDIDYTVFQMDNDFELPEIVPTPRAHMRAMKIINALGNKFNNYLEEILSGIISRKYAPQMIKFMSDYMSNPLTVEDLLKVNKSKIASAKPVERVNVVNQLIGYFKNSHSSITTSQLDNISESLSLFDKEQLGPIVREAQDSNDFNNIILELKKKSKAFTDLILKIISDDVTGKVDISKLIK